MKRIAACDIETNAIEGPDRIWLVGGKMLDTGEVFKFENIHEDSVARKEATEWHQSLDLMVGHNFLTYDVPVLNKWLDSRLDPRKVVDTVIVSRTLDFGIKVPAGGDTAHSLKSWGLRLGVHKGDFHDFSKLTDEMREYWFSDLDVTERLFNHFKPDIYNPKWSKALRAEHDLQIELVRTHYYGFTFEKNEAEVMLKEVTEELDTLVEAFNLDFPPKLTEVNRIKYRVKADGTQYKNVLEAKSNYDMTHREGDELVCSNFIDFNPGSSRVRVDVLWDAGWKPFEKTDTHVKFLRLKVGEPYGKKIKAMSQEFYDEKAKDLDRYGWKVSESNLETLPDDAGDGAKNLAKWLTLDGRQKSLTEWINQVKSDGRIHGFINQIGAWTGRCSHKNPNTANISSIFYGKPKTAVEDIKERYDHRLRACWSTPNGSYLVGCDADGIQLRVLADYLWRHFDADMYAKAIMEGTKADETDIHNVNKRALGEHCSSRDVAKTFIYSWLLGSGVGLTANILGCNERQASAARSSFENGIDGLKPLKKQLVPRIAKKGYFVGFDGRKVVVPSEYHTLAGLLQSGESVLMKHTLLNFHKKARAEQINFKMVAFVHDEYQIEVIGSKDEAEHMGKLVADTMLKTGEELGFMIPTPGDYAIGKNWRDTH